MKKLLFLDYCELERVTEFRREIEPPTKHPDAPLLTPDEPWEYNNLQMYGSVLLGADGLFRAWYNFSDPEHTYRIGYAESDDGLTWRKPKLDVFAHDGAPTNIVYFDRNEDPGIIEDRTEPQSEWRYKLLMGVMPSMCITGMCSPDGIHWTPAAMASTGVRVRRWRSSPTRLPVSFAGLTGATSPITAWRAWDGASSAASRGISCTGRVSRRWSSSPAPLIRPRCSSTGSARPRTARTRLARCGCTPPMPTTGIAVSRTACSTPSSATAGPEPLGIALNRGRRSFPTVVRKPGTAATFRPRRSPCSWTTRSGTTTQVPICGTRVDGSGSSRQPAWVWPRSSPTGLWPCAPTRSVAS